MVAQRGRGAAYKGAGGGRRASGRVDERAIEGLLWASAAVVYGGTGLAVFPVRCDDGAVSDENQRAAAAAAENISDTKTHAQLNGENGREEAERGEEC